MARLACALLALAMWPVIASAQPITPSPLAQSGVTESRGAAVEPRRDADGTREPIQHGARPDPGAVRPGSPSGDAPSASIGTLDRDREVRRIFGLPVNTALLIGGVIVAIAVVVGLAAPRVRRHREARGNGTWGRGSPDTR